MADDKNVPLSTDPFATDEHVESSTPAVKSEDANKFGTGLALTAGAKGASSALSDMSNAALRFAIKNPEALKIAPETGSMIGQGLAAASGVGTAATALATGHPIQAGEALIATGPAAWFAGRAGWHTAKGVNRMIPAAQQIAAKVALNPVMPYVQTALKGAAVLGGAQGALDLAQMAEPNRKDIGTLGVSTGPDTRDPQHPAMINDAIAAIAERMGRPDIAALWRGQKK